MTPCKYCGSTEEPICDIERMEDGSLGAGVYYHCPDCGAEVE
jgi:hypothetical protein